MPFRATQWVNHVNLAIDLPVEVIVTPQEKDTIILENRRDNTVATFSSVDKIEERFSLIRTALKNFGVEGSVAITVDSRAPYGAGLGTSGALSVALVASLTLLTGKKLPSDLFELAVAAAEIERMSGIVGGLQDQFAAAVGGLNLFQFYGSEYSSKRINLSDQHIKELEQHILILYPGGNRRSTEIVTEVMKEYRNGNSVVSNALLSLDNLAPKILEALTSADWEELSYLLSDVREQQLELHSDLIDKGNQKIINDLKYSGIRGVKLLGGGGNGACLLVISTDDKSKKVIENICEMNNVKILPVRLARNGVRANINHSIAVI